LIFPTTPSQTVGPYFAIGLPWEDGRYAAAPGTPGLLRVFGVVYDGAGSPISDHLIETWQPDPEGRFADLWGYGGASELDGFRGFARCGYEDGDGSFEIFTVKPGVVAAPPTLGGVAQAPHIGVSLFARGMLRHVVTRIYFADEPNANAADPILTALPAERRATLLAEPTDDGYRFDIHLQGPNETVFFAV
jgi:protocatechuate 3,4-dioxygenase, alpha subunit